MSTFWGEVIDDGAVVRYGRVPMTSDSLPITDHITQYGNRCGHNKLAPRYFVAPLNHKKRKPFLEKLGGRLIEAYVDPLKYGIARLFWHRDKINKRGGYRKVRSERIEALTTRLGRCIIHTVNLATLTLGHYVKAIKRFHYYGYEYLAKQVGASYSQIRRAMRHLIEAGYITVLPPKKERLANGKFVSLSAPIIQVSPQLFYDLGVEQSELMFHMERARAELAKEEKKAARVKMPETQQPETNQLTNNPPKPSAAFKQAIAEITAKLCRRYKPPE